MFSGPSGPRDAYDFDLVFLPSYDCNTNGVPDECDIASYYRLDANSNGIPDECEEGGQQMMAGGGSGGDLAGSDASADSDRTGSDAGMFDNPAWADFFEWQFEQQAALRAMSRPERFDATRAKLRALGLPDAIPWAQVRTGP